MGINSLWGCVVTDEWMYIHLLQVVERIRSGNGPKKMLVIDLETEREMAIKVCFSVTWSSNVVYS